MKKILLLSTMLMISISINAQTDSSKKQLNCYVSGSLSTSTGNNFSQSNYAGLELGVCAKNMTFGFASGRGNLDFSSDMIQNYWYELKTSASKQVGDVKCFVLAGWGQYYNTTHSFIEYGAGFSYSINKFDLCIQVSNWDKIVYVSPGIAYNFNIGKSK